MLLTVGCLPAGRGAYVLVLVLEAQDVQNCLYAAMLRRHVELAVRC
jgi:hypothetical protein